MINSLRYQAKCDRKNPGCFIFLLDQSGSMAETVLLDGQPRAKSDALAAIVNELLATIVRRCQRDDPPAPPRHYFDVGVFGYGDRKVRSLLTLPDSGSWLVPSSWLRDAAKGRRNGTEFWVAEMSSGGTPMYQAFERAGYYAEGWVHEHPKSFPPIIFNITDGQGNDATLEQTISIAGELKELRTQDGEVLLFSIGLSTKEAPVHFPDGKAAFADSWNQALFDMSSELPEVMAGYVATRLTTPILKGARAMVANARPADVLLALQTGSEPLMKN
jgi:hypothetical protein